MEPKTLAYKDGRPAKVGDKVEASVNGGRIVGEIVGLRPGVSKLNAKFKAEGRNTHFVTVAECRRLK